MTKDEKLRQKIALDKCDNCGRPTTNIDVCDFCKSGIRVYLYKSTLADLSFLPRKRAKALTGLWEVRYSDDNGMSVLARMRTKNWAMKRLKHFQAVLASGRLLTPDKSANL